MLQTYIPFQPEGAKPINNYLSIYRHDDQIDFYTASGPIYSCSENDLHGFRLAQAIIVTQGIATPSQLAKALGINRTTVYRNLKKYEQGGPAALIINKTNRQSYKLKGKNLEKVQDLLNKCHSLTFAAKEAGITEGCIRYAIKKGTVVRVKPPSETKGSLKNRLIDKRLGRKVKNENKIIEKSFSSTKSEKRKVYL